MVVLQSSLLFGAIFICAECLYISKDGFVSPIYAQVYKRESNFGTARSASPNIVYTRSAGVQPDQTVIVVPNQGIGIVSRQPYGYGTYGTSAIRGPTVIVSNAPDQYYNRVITDPYRRY